ncbi:MAG: tyrosine-protein phosphatase [Candidatus Falkowbacteria bacterium]
MKIILVLLFFICLFCSCAHISQGDKTGENPLGVQKRCYLKRCVAENLLYGESHRGAFPPNIDLVRDVPLNKIIYRSGRVGASFVPRLKDFGLKTIITLGTVDASTRAAIKEAGLIHKEFGFTSENLNAEKIQRVIDDIKTLPGPMLVHCRAGADRTGLVIACLRAHCGEDDHDMLFAEMRGYCHVTFKKYRYYHEILDWFIRKY